jgi:hypothetical protein
MGGHLHLHAMRKHGQWRLNLTINAVLSKTTSLFDKASRTFPQFFGVMHIYRDCRSLLRRTL